MAKGISYKVVDASYLGRILGVCDVGGEDDAFEEEEREEVGDCRGREREVKES